MVAIDTSDLLNVKTGHRLLVGDDRKGFQQRVGQRIFLRSFGDTAQIIVKFRPGTHLPGIFERNQVHPPVLLFPACAQFF